MSRHSWPGNLRQYMSVLRTAVAMLDTHETCIEQHCASTKIGRYVDAGDTSGAERQSGQCFSRSEATGREPANLVSQTQMTRSLISAKLANC